MTPISLDEIFEQVEILKHDLKKLEDLIHQVVVSQADKIEELENLVDPYCNSGNSICNSHWQE
jgi:tetrahydromethanopterin S-methyltransferase subunit B